MKYTERFIFGVGTLLMLSLGNSAFACSTANWSDDSNISPPSSAASPTAVSRWSESCGFKVANASWVQSDHASDQRFIGRFYVLPQISGPEVDLFVAYSAETPSGELFAISYDGSNFKFDTTGAGGAVKTLAAPAGWSLVEFEYDAGTDVFNVWLNKEDDWDAQNGVYTTTLTPDIETWSISTDTAIEAVVLGVPDYDTNNNSGMVTFDAFEAHRTTNVGALKTCDADANTSVDILDILAQINEVFGNPSELGQGQPDCDKNGSVDILDILAAINIVFPS